MTPSEAIRLADHYEKVGGHPPLVMALRSAAATIERLVRNNQALAEGLERARFRLENVAEDAKLGVALAIEDTRKGGAL